jgi:hypothetical protein
VGRRTPYRYASGDVQIPEPAARLLRLLVLLRLTFNKHKFEDIVKRAGRLPEQTEGNKAMIRNFVLLAAIVGIKALYAQTYPKPVTTIPMVQTAPEAFPTAPKSDLAQTVTTVPTKPINRNILPPVEYDHWYEGDLTIKIVDSLEELYILCAVKKDYMLACALPGGTSCVIIMVNDEIMRTQGWTTGVLVRHEIGHCNGWPGDHGGVRALPSSNTHWVPEAQRMKLPLDRLERAKQVRTGAPR